MASDTNSVIDVGTAARILAVSEATVRNYLVSGQLKGQKILGSAGGTAHKRQRVVGGVVSRHGAAYRAAAERRLTWLLSQALIGRGPR